MLDDLHFDVCRSTYLAASRENVMEQSFFQAICSTAAALMHAPRIRSVDSHDMIIGPDGKVSYIPKEAPKQQLTYAQV